MISRSRRDSAGGGGVVAEFFPDLQEPNTFYMLIQCSGCNIVDIL